MPTTKVLPPDFETCPHGRDIAAMREDLHEIKQVLVGDMDTEEPGLKERIRKLETFKASITRSLIGLGTLAGTALFVALWQLLFSREK